jgi:hypothetical protein
MAPPISPPSPDGIPNLADIAAKAAATASGSTAKTDIWNLPSDLDGKSITTKYGSRVSPGLARHLEPGDVAQQESSQTEQLGIQKDPNNPNGPGIPTGPYALPINMYSTNPKGYLDLQRALFAAGYFGSKSQTSINWGSDTAATMEAWTNLLRDTIQQQSLGHNVTWQDVLTSSATNAASAAKGSTLSKPIVNQYTDPAQVAA